MPRALALATLALASCSATDDAEPPRERASLDPARSSAPPTPAPAPPAPVAGASAPSDPPAEPTPSAPAAPASAPPPPPRADLVSACERRPELPCTRDGDLDGDGQRDTVALVRPKDGLEIERRSYRALAVRGDGLLVDGGDSAAVA